MDSSFSFLFLLLYCMVSFIFFVPYHGLSLDTNNHPSMFPCLALIMFCLVSALSFVPVCFCFCFSVFVLPSISPTPFGLRGLRRQRGDTITIHTVDIFCTYIDRLGATGASPAGIPTTLYNAIIQPRSKAFSSKRDSRFQLPQLAAAVYIPLVASPTL